MTNDVVTGPCLIADAIQEARARFLQLLAGLRETLRPRVLIADDNAVFASLLRDALEKRGILADVALDEGGARMLIARHGDYELLVLDGAYEPSPGENVPVLYVSGRTVEGWRAPQIGFKSKADGVAEIADEVVRLCHAVG